MNKFWAVVLAGVVAFSFVITIGGAKAVIVPARFIDKNEVIFVVVPVDSRISAPVALPELIGVIDVSIQPQLFAFSFVWNFQRGTLFGKCLRYQEESNFLSRPISPIQGAIRSRIIFTEPIKLEQRVSNSGRCSPEIFYFESNFCIPGVRKKVQSWRVVGYRDVSAFGTAHCANGLSSRLRRKTGGGGSFLRLSYNLAGSGKGFPNQNYSPETYPYRQYARSSHDPLGGRIAPHSPNGRFVTGGEWVVRLIVFFGLIFPIMWGAAEFSWRGLDSRWRFFSGLTGGLFCVGLSGFPLIVWPFFRLYGGLP